MGHVALRGRGDGGAGRPVERARTRLRHTRALQTPTGCHIVIKFSCFFYTPNHLYRLYLGSTVLCGLLARSAGVFDTSLYSAVVPRGEFAGTYVTYLHVLRNGGFIGS